MKTYSQKPAEVTRKWYVLDATDASLGRLATQAASLLIGKGKPTITAHVDGGDYVVIINADNLQVTGKKVSDKTYYRHTQFPGGIKQKSLSERLAIDSTEVVVDAIRGMLPVNKLRPARLARLKVYAGSDHSHEAQKPEVITISKDSK